MQYAKNILLLIGIATLATSCVSKKKYDMAIEELDGLRIERARLVTDLSIVKHHSILPKHRTAFLQKKMLR